MKEQSASLCSPHTLSQEPAFVVTPKLTDIPAKSTAEFRVHFRPQVDNSFYGAQLECYVSFKSMRSFRLVNEDTFTPSFCLTPMVAGYAMIHLQC